MRQKPETEPCTARVTVTMPPSLQAAVEKAAASHDRPVTYYARAALAEKLERDGVAIEQPVAA